MAHPPAAHSTTANPAVTSMPGPSVTTPHMHYPGAKFAAGPDIGRVNVIPPVFKDTADMDRSMGGIWSGAAGKLQDDLTQPQVPPATPTVRTSISGTGTGTAGTSSTGTGSRVLTAQEAAAIVFGPLDMYTRSLAPGMHGDAHAARDQAHAADNPDKPGKLPNQSQSQSHMAPGHGRWLLHDRFEIVQGSDQTVAVGGIAKGIVHGSKATLVWARDTWACHSDAADAPPEGGVGRHSTGGPRVSTGGGSQLNGSDMVVIKLYHRQDLRDAAAQVSELDTRNHRNCLLSLPEPLLGN